MRDLLRHGKSQLEAAGISTVDAELLLAHVLGVSRMDLHSKVIPISDEDEQRITDEYQVLITERLTGKPTQYIVGEAPFRYLVLDVGPGVLIPRPETEVLVDEVLHHLQKFDEPVSIIDLGAGSGAISIALASETAGKKDVRIIAVEKSDDAVVWLRQNIAKFDLPIRVVQADVVDALPEIKADVVVTNPPYIPNAEVLPSEVADFEPEIALRGGSDDGLAIPALFIAAAERLLKPGGLLAIEHHEDQAEGIRTLLSDSFTNILTHNDLTERARFSTAFKAKVSTDGRSN